MSRFLFAMALGFTLAIGVVAVSPTLQADQAAAIDAGWRFTDGYWNYWDPTDKSWYYTDGRNWFSHSDGAWKVYSFDRNFGRKGFVREGYVAPKPGPDLVVPRHKIYVP